MLDWFQFRIEVALFFLSPFQSVFESCRCVRCYVTLQCRCDQIKSQGVFREGQFSVEVTIPDFESKLPNTFLYEERQQRPDLCRRQPTDLIHPVSSRE